jgi:microcystin-dependent protein
MSATPFVGEIAIFAFDFPPVSWAQCNGQILPLSQNTALFALLGTTYGGDGKSTFALPNLQGATPIGPGQGPGLENHDLGETGGETLHYLVDNELPFHTHSLPNLPLSLPVGAANNAQSPVGNHFANTGTSSFYGADSTANSVPVINNLVVAGSQQNGVNNMQPSLVLNFCIAMAGVFPPRT